MFTGLSTVKQGNVGLAIAIAELTKLNGVVAIPLTDIQEYDLIVDFGEGLKKVQVKTTSYKQNNNYVCQLKSVRPNRTKNIIRKLDNTLIDFLFVVCDNDDKYFIPSKKIISGNQITLNKTYSEFKIMGKNAERPLSSS